MLLWITCGLVSFFHGQNDGQKGVGLIMFILIAVLPGQFALDSSVNLQASKANVNKIELLMNKVDTTVLSKKEKTIFAEIHKHSKHFEEEVANKFDTHEVSLTSRFAVRKDVIKITKGAEKLIKEGNLSLSSNEIREVKNEISAIKKNVNFGGVDNTSVPNYVFRWTEKEIFKLFNSYKPEIEHNIIFNYSFHFKFFKSVAINLLLTIFFFFFKKQGNLMSIFINKDKKYINYKNWYKI
jgi:phosphate/sulfate permease